MRELRTIGTMSIDTEMKIREVCRNFVIALVMELQNRLPSNIDTLKNASQLSPENCLRTVKPSILPLARLMQMTDDDISKTEIQWRKINFVEWKNVSNTTSFWAEVSFVSISRGL